uniref:Uncharacterized protein n=1 Tax=Anguilla anguilla TaxID=7936 RepID=A0A0E9PKR9_ANGAN
MHILALFLVFLLYASIHFPPSPI